MVRQFSDEIFSFKGMIEVDRMRDPDRTELDTFPNRRLTGILKKIWT